MKSKDLLTVGELAKLMNVTVRTLQYYDNYGLLKPSSKSEGGRRLYTKKDIVKLHQILAFKYLGFSLADIKQKLICLDGPKDADIITLIREKNEGYWVFKFFDDKLMNHIRDKFANEPDSGIAIFEKWKFITDEVLRLKEDGETPESQKGQGIAKEFWKLIMDFTDGDMSMLPLLKKFNETKNGWDREMQKKQVMTDEFIGKALEIYFKKNGIQSPFLEE